MRRLSILVAVIALAGCGKGAVSMQVPESQQQAQDTVLRYLRETLAALPPGTVLDATRFGGAGHNSYCDDDAVGADVPMNFHTIGELKVPGEPDGAGVVTAVGELWRSWGWQVIERDGFRTPNRFGYSPDGYDLQIVIAGRPGYPPSVQAGSPCFPQRIARDGIPFPGVLRVG